MLAGVAESSLDSLERLASAAPPETRRLVSVTIELDEPLDAAATVFASRRATDRWFCWEQPDAEFALAGLGTACEVVTRGPGRFEEVGRACAGATLGRLAEEPSDLPAGAGPVWVGGFAFSPDGGTTPQWSSFPPALAVLPELSIACTAGRCLITLTALLGPGPGSESALRRVESRVGSLASAALPLLDPHPTGRIAIRSARAPEHYESAVGSVRKRIREGELEKAVLAREVTVDAPSAHDPAALHGALRELFPACFCFCVGSPEGAFCGASPELLVRRRGAGAATVALAGSARRSADPAVDDHLGEQLLRSDKERSEHAIVARRIKRSLDPHSVWVEAAPDPGLVKVANVQHMATPIRAQLADSLSAVELAGLLHPTPAVGGEPSDRALATISELEDMDRGWYAGPVGWMDAAEDGEYCVALRSALLRDRRAHLYAGAGIVAESDPAAELAETEVKLDAILPLLAG